MVIENLDKSFLMSGRVGFGRIPVRKAWIDLIDSNNYGQWAHSQFDPIAWCCLLGSLNPSSSSPSSTFLIRSLNQHQGKFS